MPKLIEQGYVYIAQPPLYGAKRGNDIHYFYNDAALNKFMGETDKKWSLQRYKGLGEMDAEQLWQTTMDEDNRIILQVAVDDAIQAEAAFSDLMGDNVEPRREYIQNNARYVSNLDI
jgi:DNA gyrase subunit B